MTFFNVFAACFFLTFIGFFLGPWFMSEIFKADMEALREELEAFE